MSDAEPTEASIPELPVPPVAAELFGSRLPAAETYTRLLATVGVERGLIGPRETGRLWERHVLNCAVLAEAVPDGADVVDVGSGAGLPGIPLALARPDVRVVLVEPMERRCRFLQEVVVALGLEDQVSVQRGRAPDAGIGPDGRRFGVAVARAVAPLERLGAILLPMLQPGGVMLAMRGSRILEELQDARGSLGTQGWHPVDVVECGEGRVDEPTRVLRAVRATGLTRAESRKGRGDGERHDGRQVRRTARESRRSREVGRDQPTRGQSRST
ncbi:Ribosomal RNA small subunit methyltransferase G [Frankia canadensis]|uniref:Ribosomal RNA small subunit methyltransferase G n=1 Tax=Frankia canadensis TaxID=1836972 RepID=A0A2I2L0K3_9ACTN|nr:16S rRNA (guanine(527)-N(7))-methyltransferase RsmG [Frankia canadensis]SNQ51429.1 Ribosomal RNA small subunit methyltransferase G [Frankia canadensis]SOU58719.1 Ribosomal RNA small subunit methyltransferase G [Frankia canadensis]